jgi:hypothetical protein
MNINPQYKLTVRELLKTGQRNKAVQYLSEQLAAGLYDAEKLVTAVEFEIATERQQQDQTIEKTGNFLLGCGSIVFKTIGVGFAICSFACILAAIVIYFVFNIPNAISVEGTVTEFQTNDTGTAPVIEFIWQGETKIYKSQTYSEPNPYTSGQPVTLLVNQENPDEVVIDSFEERWMAISVLGGTGLFMLLLTTVFFTIGKKIKRSL